MPSQKGTIQGMDPGLNGLGLEASLAEPASVTCLACLYTPRLVPCGTLGLDPAGLGLHCTHTTPRAIVHLAPQSLLTSSCVFPDLPSSIQAEPPCHPCPGYQCEKETTWR